MRPSRVASSHPITAASSPYPSSAASTTATFAAPHSLRRQSSPFRDSQRERNQRSPRYGGFCSPVISPMRSPLPHHTLQSPQFGLSLALRATGSSFGQRQALLAEGEGARTESAASAGPLPGRAGRPEGRGPNTVQGLGLLDFRAPCLHDRRA